MLRKFETIDTCPTCPIKRRECKDCSYFKGWDFNMTLSPVKKFVDCSYRKIKMKRISSFCFGCLYYPEKIRATHCRMGIKIRVKKRKCNCLNLESIKKEKKHEK